MPTSLTSTAAAVRSEAERYNLSGSQGIAFERTGGEIKKFFKSFRLWSHSFVHSNRFDLEEALMTSYKGRHLLDDCGMNLRSAVIHPVKT